VQFNNAEENTTAQTNDESLLNLPVEKLTECESCNGEEDVKDEIQQFLLEGEIPLFMMPQGLYPPWVKEIASFVLKQLEKMQKLRRRDTKRGIQPNLTREVIEKYK